MTETDLLPIGEAAKRLGNSPTTLRRLVREGALPVYTRPIDRRLRLVRRQDVDALAMARRLEPREEAPVPA